MSAGFFRRALAYVFVRPESDRLADELSGALNESHAYLARRLDNVERLLAGGPPLTVFAARALAPLRGEGLVLDDGGAPPTLLRELRTLGHDVAPLGGDASPAAAVLLLAGGDAASARARVKTGGLLVAVLHDDAALPGWQVVERVDLLEDADGWRKAAAGERPALHLVAARAE